MALMIICNSFSCLLDSYSGWRSLQEEPRRTSHQKPLGAERIWDISKDYASTTPLQHVARQQQEVLTKPQPDGPTSLFPGLSFEERRSPLTGELLQRGKVFHSKIHADTPTQDQAHPQDTSRPLPVMGGASGGATV
ncbi:hypothetical protein FQA47_022208 [Oryzias melastigma]|uniref:Uncharacterized protein n=1 Tax=Oryzias melastigma TaxID=30732 RepID=A0A834FN86_ORYME|nr:hypothetical protein FQA47_022208 [Oryzias melastigma]